MARSEQGGACRHLLGVQRRSPEQCRLRAAAGARIDPVASAPALVVGYGNLVDARLDEAVARLAAAVAEAT